MRWSSRVGDLANILFVVGPDTPDCSLQALRANLSGSNRYTTSVDVNGGSQAGSNRPNPLNRFCARQAGYLLRRLLESACCGSCVSLV